MSLDGYIAGAGGEYDWIVMDPDFDFSEHLSQFDTFLIGRKTFEAMRQMGSNAQSMTGTQNVVFSRKLGAADYPHVVMSDDSVRFVTELRARPGKDIALFGGGELFRSLLESGLVDRVDLLLVPVLLGGGIPLLPPPAPRTALQFRKQRLYERTGTIVLEYEIIRA
jgi:dihydrofolate reductase